MAPGQPEGKEDKNRMVMIIIIFIVAAIAVFVFFTSGAGGLTSFIKSIMTYVFIAVIIGLIVWAVMKILQKPKVDLVENDRQDIIDAGKQSKPPMVRDLYFTGDREHGEFRVGTITGYCQIHSYKDLDVIAGLTKKQLQEMEHNNDEPSAHLIKEDCFVFKTMPFPFNFFEQPKVLRCLEDEHSQLIGDVKVYSVSMIKKYGYYFPSRAYLDIARIDIGIIREAWRGQIHQFLKDMVSINQRAVGLDSEFKKDLDARKLLKIPSPMGEEPVRRGD
jgi:hypothetical protein